MKLCKIRLFNLKKVTSPGQTQRMEEQTVFSYISIFHIFIYIAWFQIVQKARKVFLKMLMCDIQSRLWSDASHKWSEPVLAVPPQFEFYALGRQRVTVLHIIKLKLFSRSVPVPVNWNVVFISPCFVILKNAVHNLEPGETPS